MTLLGMAPMAPLDPIPTPPARVDEYRVARLHAFILTLDAERRPPLLRLLRRKGFDAAFGKLTQRETGKYQSFLATYLREQVRWKLNK